jgi:hypothetical protein
LDKAAARRIVDYMDQRIASLEDARSLGKALRGPLGEFWRYRVGDYRIVCDLQDEKVARLGGADWKSKRCLPIEANKMLFCSSFPSSDRNRRQF